MAPPPPSIDGTTSGFPGEDYEYTFVTRDPYKDPVYYYVEWGDGTSSDWIGPEPSGKKLKLTHNWTEIETYTIRCKAKDFYDLESDWATLTVTMPRNRISTNNLIMRFLEQFPILRLLFQRLGLQ